jgi:MYXO-CTERM domain-containing protein
MKKTAALFALAGIASIASADLLITEIYAGVDGEDGTADWFEVVNTGDSAIDLGDFAYEDDSAVSTGQSAIASLVLGAGQVAIVLADADASDIAAFQDVWGYNGLITHTNGDGGGLSQGGDTVNLINIMSQSITTSQVIPNTGGAFSSVDFVGSPTLSLFVGYAYESNQFFDEDTMEFRTLFASPGIIPAPGAAALLALGGLVGSRRRR